MNKFRLMRKMIYPPSIFWLVVSCSAFAVCIFLLHFVWIKLIPLPPSPQLFDWIASIVSVFIFLIFIIGVICAIITFDFWCRPVFLTENEITRGFIFRRRIKKEAALQALMLHNTGKDGWTFSGAMLDSVRVFKLEVETLSCKEHE